MKSADSLSSSDLRASVNDKGDDLNPARSKDISLLFDLLLTIIKPYANKIFLIRDQMWKYKESRT